MNSNFPKQYLPLAGVPVIERTLEKLLSISAVGTILVAIGKQDTWWAKTSFAEDVRVRRVTGGQERSASVLACLEQLIQTDANPNDWVLVHDAVRPCVSLADINKLIDCCLAADRGGLLAAPVYDTLKQANEEGEVVKTIPREGLWRAFTPQLFRLNFLYSALVDARAGGVVVTDEASALERVGYQPLLVKGHTDNIKITSQADLRLAEYYCQRDTDVCA